MKTNDKIKNAVDNILILLSTEILTNNKEIKKIITAEINDDNDSKIEQRAIVFVDLLCFLYEENNIPYRTTLPGIYLPNSDNALILSD